MEFRSLSEKILNTIANIIKNNPLIEDFTIIPTDNNSTNKSPVVYELYHLGLESWCVKFVYQYICSELFEHRKKKLNCHVNLKNLIMGGLLINPDVTTFWNMRRELVEADICNYEEEFLFSKLVLTRKNKSNDAFSYRRWLFKRIEDEMKSGIPSVDHILFQDERAICCKVAHSSQNNYHVWTHRIWCMENFLPYYPDILTRELVYSETFIRGHVSENCGFHYRRFLINYIKINDKQEYLGEYITTIRRSAYTRNGGNEITRGLELCYVARHIMSLFDLTSHNRWVIPQGKIISYLLLLFHDLYIIRCIDRTFNEHETTWLHRRYILYEIFSFCYESLHEPSTIPEKIDFSDISIKQSEDSVNTNFIDSLNDNSDSYCETQPKMSKIQPSKFKSSTLYQVICDNEKQSIVEKCNNGTKLEILYAKRHLKWVKYFLGIDLNL